MKHSRAYEHGMVVLSCCNGKGCVGGGTVVSLWHEVTMLTLGLDIAGICKEAGLWLFCGFSVWNVFGG